MRNRLSVLPGWLLAIASLLLGAAALPVRAAAPDPAAGIFFINELTTSKGNGTARFNPEEPFQVLVEVSHDATATLTLHESPGSDLSIWTNVSLKGGVTYSIPVTEHTPGARTLVLTATDGVTSDTATCYYEVIPSPVHLTRANRIELLTTNQGDGATFTTGQPFLILFRLSDPATVTLSIGRADGTFGRVLASQQLVLGGTTYQATVVPDEPGAWIIQMTADAGPATVGGDERTSSYTVVGVWPPPSGPLIEQFTSNKGDGAMFVSGEPIQINVVLSRPATITGDGMRSDGGFGWRWAAPQQLAAGQTYVWTLPPDDVYPDQWVLQLTATDANGYSETATCSFTVVTSGPLPPVIGPAASGSVPPPVE